MRPIFIITSAINVTAGTFSAKSRLRQTNMTVESIIRYYPNALLMLLEGGQAISEGSELFPSWNALRKRMHFVMDASIDPRMKEIHQYFLENVNNKNEKGNNLGLNKTFAELMLLSTVLSVLKNYSIEGKFSNVDRVFKISGRYQLSPLFDASAYLNFELKDKYVFAKKRLSWMKKENLPFDTAYLYQSRLWSFPLNLLDDLMVRVQSMVQAYMQLKEQGIYVDMEHLLFKYISGSSTVEFPFVHVMGAIAPNGVVVYD